MHRRSLSVVTFLVGALFGPGVLLRADAAPLYEGDAEAQVALGRGVDRWVEAPLGEADFGTGHRRFDGEWLFGTYVMGAMGHGQVALTHPRHRAGELRRMEACLDAALRPEARGFDAAAWGHDPLDDIGTSRAHVAWLGYLHLALALHRYLDPQSRYADLEGRITAHLARLSRRSRLGLLETYPGEVYPVDNASFIGALGLHDRATGEDHGALIARFRRAVDARYADPATGLLYQRVRLDGRPADRGRGSGTAFAAYFLAFADRALSEQLYRALETHLARRGLGFAAMREYAPATARYDDVGDIDSGPVLLGLGVSPTGFALGPARIHGDEDTFAGLYATAALFGAPVDHAGGRSFALGGPIGDALLFAMLTAPRRIP